MACAQLEAGGNRLLLEGVRPEVLETLQRNDLVDRIGSENIFPFSSELHSALDAAWEAAQEMVSRARHPRAPIWPRQRDHSKGMTTDPAIPPKIRVTSSKSTTTERRP
jgi:hypothetical protein